MTSKCKSDCVNCPSELYRECNFGKKHQYLASIGLESPNKIIEDCPRHGAKGSYFNNRCNCKQ